MKGMGVSSVPEVVKRFGNRLDGETPSPLSSLPKIRERSLAYRMKTLLLAVGYFVLALVPTFAGPPTREDFMGVFQGEALGKSTTGQSFVLRLDVSKEEAEYSLAASMNDTNREEGMDHTSNTHWKWTGTGKVRDGALVFSFVDQYSPPAKGSLRRKDGKFVLQLGTVKYRLERSR